MPQTENGGKSLENSAIRLIESACGHQQVAFALRSWLICFSCTRGGWGRLVLPFLPPPLQLLVMRPPLLPPLPTSPLFPGAAPSASQASLSGEVTRPGISRMICSPRQGTRLHPDTHYPAGGQAFSTDLRLQRIEAEGQWPEAYVWNHSGPTENQKELSGTADLPPCPSPRTHPRGPPKSTPAWCP